MQGGSVGSAGHRDTSGRRRRIAHCGRGRPGRLLAATMTARRVGGDFLLPLGGSLLVEERRQRRVALDCCSRHVAAEAQRPGVGDRIRNDCRRVAAPRASDADRRRARTETPGEAKSRSRIGSRRLSRLAVPSVATAMRRSSARVRQHGRQLLLDRIEPTHERRDHLLLSLDRALLLLHLVDQQGREDVIANGVRFAVAVIGH